ncbi:MAG: peptide deformylase [Isosphaeraceae bacterium]
MLRIVHYPHPALRYPSVPVARIDAAFRGQVREMFDRMYEAQGIGLAANQVAIPRRFFVLNLTADPSQADHELVFINPTIVKRHGQVEEEEGCLSLPALYGKVKRARKVRVRAYNLDGEEVEYDADDLFSRAIQHETDHLDGKLFIDALDDAARKAANEKIRALRGRPQGRAGIGRTRRR